MCLPFFLRHYTVVRKEELWYHGHVKWLIPLACALCLCSCKKGQPNPAAGNSRHWDQQAVPVSLQCAACHAKEFEEWAGSDHAWAWRPVDPALDSEPFHGQKLKAHGSELTFSTGKKGELLIRDAGSGKSYEVQAVLGRTPLVQYLVKGEDGGLHTPSAAWDTLRHEWFDMFEDDARLAGEGQATRAAGDWGHWLGRGMNWNSQCAWCHMSGFRKNYDEKADRYASTWQEPGVTCIQCHKLAAQSDPADGCMVARKDRKLTARQIHDNCASCHARREELDGDFQAGDLFDDHFRLELPMVEGVFWPDGRQRDEDYCETGLRLSRMGAAGVTCLDCHDPHTARLKLPQEDDSLCLRCHGTGLKVGTTASPIIEPSTHSPCPATGDNRVTCVDCHAPESPYMARDPRRDHSFNSPDPLLDEELGMPNVCLRCHTDKDARWAEEATRRHWPEQKMASRRMRTRAVAAALKGQENGASLQTAYLQETVPAWRATLLELMARQPSSASGVWRQLAKEASRDAHPMIRAAAAPLLDTDNRKILLDDPVRLVRRAATWPLLYNLPPYGLRQPSLKAAIKEWEETARFQSDQPTGAMQLAALADAQGNRKEAERQYRRAIQLDPAGYIAYMDFAVFLARQDRLGEALSQMLACAKVAPENPLVFYRLGLILTEVQQYEPALQAFDKALRLDPDCKEAQAAKAQLLPYLRRTRAPQQKYSPPSTP